MLGRWGQRKENGLMRQEVAKNPPQLKSQESQARGQVGRVNSYSFRVFPKRQYLWKGGVILHHPASLPTRGISVDASGKVWRW